MWRIQILIEGQQAVWSMYGTEEAMRNAREELLDKRPTGEFVTIHGICDSSDRAPHEMTIKSDEVIAIDLCRMAYT